MLCSFRTLRDMNLSKLVADDVPLFLSLLKDIFPRQADPPKKYYREVENAVIEEIRKQGLVQSDAFLIKIMQLYEVTKAIVTSDCTFVVLPVI